MGELITEGSQLEVGQSLLFTHFEENPCSKILKAIKTTRLSKVYLDS